MRSILAAAIAALAAVPALDAAPAFAACEPAVVATIPLISIDRPVIHATIDNVAVVLLVDTGSQTTIVTPETAARIGLKRDPDQVSHLAMLSGGHAVPNVLVDKLSFPSVNLFHLSLPSLTLRSQAADGQDGVIGDDILHNFDLDIDVPHQKLTLYHAVTGCTAAQPPWNAPAQSWPITISSRWQITFPAVINGHKLTALLDTGSFHGTLARPAALRVGVTAADLQHDFASRTAGPLGYDVKRHHFNSVAFGGQNYPDTWLDVVDFDQEGVDMLIGVDYLLTRRVFISYAHSTIFISPEAAAP